MNSKINKFLVAFTAIIIFVVIIATSIIYFNTKLNSTPYKTYHSPDKKFKIEVSSFHRPHFGAPGGGGDFPGMVFLKDSSGKVLKECKVDMVQLVENPQWSADEVHMKFIATWKLK